LIAALAFGNLIALTDTIGCSPSITKTSGLPEV